MVKKSTILIRIDFEQYQSRFRTNFEQISSEFRTVNIVYLFQSLEFLSFSDIEAKNLSKLLKILSYSNKNINKKIRTF